MTSPCYQSLIWHIQPHELEKFIASGVNVNQPDDGGDFLLTVACHRLQLASVEILLAAGANPNVRNAEEESPLLCAIDCVEHNPSEALQIASLLVDRGADLEQRGHMDKTPFLKACSRSNLEMVRFLVEAGANVKAKARDIGGEIGGQELAEIFRAPPLMLAYLEKIGAA